MLKPIYQVLKTHLGNIPEVEEVDWFLDQYNQDDEGSVLWITPSLFLEFQPIPWMTLSQNVQRAVLTFVVHTVTDSVYDDDERILDAATDHLQLVDDVFASLQGKRFADNGRTIMETIVRTSMIPDHSIEGIIVTTQEFKSVIFNYSARPQKQVVQITNLDIKSIFYNKTKRMQFIGETVMFVGTFAPKGWAFCDGQLLNIADYSFLYSIMGTRFGGDGVTTFALPDLRGRVPVGENTGVYNLGQTGGQESVALTEAQLPAHSHAVNAVTTVGNSNVPTGRSLADSAAFDNEYSDLTPDTIMSSNMIANTGNGDPVDIRQPFTCVNFIVALEGEVPVSA